MRTLILITTCAALLSCSEAPLADASAAELRQGARMLALVEASPVFRQIPTQCPLDVYRTRSNVASSVPDCGNVPGICLALCEAGNSDACFDAARVIEISDIEPDSDATYPLFMAGCALGDDNACVNAGATVKNGAWAGTPPAGAATARCQFQTYDRMCDDGAPWGCYMVAQEYLRSDGFQPRSEAKHEASMRRACDLDADSGACEPEFQ